MCANKLFFFQFEGEVRRFGWDVGVRLVVESLRLGLVEEVNRIELAQFVLKLLDSDVDVDVLLHVHIGHIKHLALTLTLIIIRVVIIMLRWLRSALFIYKLTQGPIALVIYWVSLQTVEWA